MARVVEGHITLGSRIIGRVRADPGAVRAAGGPHEPRLIIPVTAEMHTRAADEMLALIQLTGTLHDDAVNLATSRVGTPHTAHLINGMPCRSLPEGVVGEVVDMEFGLSPFAVNRLEDVRRRTGSGACLLHLSLDGTVAWLKQTNGDIGASDGPTPFGTSLGLHSELSVFWSTKIGVLNLSIEPSAWVANVLPGLGVDRVRMVELTLPPSLPDTGNAGARWDEARRAFHAQRYNDSIAACRSLIRAWNGQLGATSKKHLADIVAEQCGWPTDDPRRALLDAIWQGLIDVANAPHHQEDQAVAFEASPADAELHMLMTAVVSNYVAEVTSKRRT
jgi:hypothetical protein